MFSDTGQWRCLQNTRGKERQKNTTRQMLLRKAYTQLFPGSTFLWRLNKIWYHSTQWGREEKAVDWERIQGGHSFLGDSREKGKFQKEANKVPKVALASWSFAFAQHLEYWCLLLIERKDWLAFVLQATHLIYSVSKNAYLAGRQQLWLQNSTSSWDTLKTNTDVLSLGHVL